MREHLLGYLCNALDPAEHDLVEQRLAQDAQLRNDLEAIDRALQLVRADRALHDPPSGLSQRTCDFVFRQALVATAVEGRPAATAGTVSLSPRPVGYAPGRWSMADAIVAAGICCAAAMLIIPAVSNSRYEANLNQCANNLRDLGVSLTSYSDQHDGYFPEVPTRGNQAVAGIYASKLHDGQYLTDENSVICPASSLAVRKGAFHIPSLDDLSNASGENLTTLQRQVGGSYGYNLGYEADGKYHTTKNLRRPNFAMMADSPGCELTRHISSNHAGSGQNVLFEDGHVKLLHNGRDNGQSDDIFVNEQGTVAAGTHQNDAVIGPSAAHPVLWPLRTNPDTDR